MVLLRARSLSQRSKLAPAPEEPSGQARLGLSGLEKGDFRSWLFLAPACRSRLQDRRLPQSNRGYWLPKLERNAARDAQHATTLKKSGWKVLILWECEVEGDTGLRDRIREFLTPVRNGFSA